MEGGSRWGRISQEVHGALESQEGPERWSQEGLDKELNIINSCAGLRFISIQESFQLVIKLKAGKHTVIHCLHRMAVNN